MTSEFAIGVHAMVYLQHKQEIVSSEALAENVCTNPARVRKVMAKLKKNGLVETREGQHGGYTICKDGADVTLNHVCQAVSERFIKSSWKTGSEDMDCLVASGMAAIMDDIYGNMNEMCCEYLTQITIGDIEKKIFGK